MPQLVAPHRILVGAVSILFTAGLPVASAQSGQVQALAEDVALIASVVENLRNDVDAVIGDAVVDQLGSLSALVQSIELRLDQVIDNDRAQKEKIIELAQRLARLEQTLEIQPVVPDDVDGDLPTGAGNDATGTSAATSPLSEVSPTLIETPTVRANNGEVPEGLEEPRPAFSTPPRLYPGPVVPIERSDEQGDIERPIPQRRPGADVDPQPMSKAEFLSLFGADAVVDRSSSDEVSANEPAITATQAYNAAYAFIEVDDLASAEVAFQDFLDLFPDHPLASNAGYWLGESFYARDMYGAAVRAFAGSVRDHRDGRKAPDSLLKLSLTLAVLGQKSEACRLLDFLPQEYPDASDDVLS